MEDNNSKRIRALYYVKTLIPNIHTIYKSQCDKEPFIRGNVLISIDKDSSNDQRDPSFFFFFYFRTSSISVFTPKINIGREASIAGRRIPINMYWKVVPTPSKKPGERCPRTVNSLLLSVIRDGAAKNEERKEAVRFVKEETGGLIVARVSEKRSSQCCLVRNDRKLCHRRQYGQLLEGKTSG